MASPATKRKKCTTGPTESIYDKEMQMQPKSISVPPSPPNANTTVPVPIDIFALNGDCVRKICDYCTVADMYNMCLASDKLEMQIVQNAVRGRTIKFAELADSCHLLDVFKMFGSNMTKVEIGEKDIQYKERKYSKFDEILRLITVYCSVDTIKQLTLLYYHGTTIRKRFLYASLPFFRCVEALTVKETDQHSMEDCINYFESNSEFNSSIDSFVERVVANAVNVKALQFYNLKISGRLFYLDHIRNLKLLTVDGCNIRTAEAFLSFLRAKPKLKSLAWINSSIRGMDTDQSHSSNLVYELAADSLTNLEAFHYYPNEGFINDDNKYDSDFQFQLPDYKHLAKYRNLKELSIPGLNLACLNVLAQRNTVEKLLTCFTQAHSNRDHTANDFNFLRDFTSLKCVQLFTSFDDRAKLFNKELLSNAHHLTECYLDFYQIDENLIEIAVKSAKNLSTLNISLRRGKFTVALYTKLREIRSESGLKGKPLVVYVELKVVKQLLSRLDGDYRPDEITVRASV